MGDFGERVGKRGRPSRSRRAGRTLRVSPTELLPARSLVPARRARPLAARALLCTRHTRALAVALLVGAGCASSASQALAVFPFYGTGKAEEPATWKLAPGETLTNLGTELTQHFGAVPATPPASEPVEKAEVEKLNSQEDQLCGVMGMSITDGHATMPAGLNSCIKEGTPIHTAMQVTVGRPDVQIAELDSGIKWDNAGDMLQLRGKYLLNPGELPMPKVDMTKTFDPSTHVDCETARAATGGDYDSDGGMPGGKPGGSGPIPYDVLEQGVFNVLDYACDSRVANVVKNYPQCTNPPTTKECRNGPVGMLNPEDLIIAFSDGIDHDHDGFVNDIAGWNFVDNNNDPYDEVQYGHGTGEEEDSSAEANNGVQDSGVCPNCEIMELRVGESFVADANRFAEAVNFATDRGVDIIQEPLGTYNDSLFTREAIEYAYHHGVTIMASAADEAAEHHNQPSAEPDVIVVNAIRGPDTIAHVEGFNPSLNTSQPPSWLQLDGCTNFGTRIDLSVEGNSCSSEATGKSSGVAGLIYSAALNACGAALYGSCSSSPSEKLKPSSDCIRVNGEPCVITPNEVRQLLASGNIEGTTVNASSQIGSKAPSTGKASADEGEGGQADDIDTAAEPETACSVGMAPSCTDPNLNTTFAADEDGGVQGNLPDTFLYPSRKGWDEFFGYGRLDAYKSVEAAAQGWIPPEADITSPDWFQQMNPNEGSFALDGEVNAREGYTCTVEIAPGVDPNNRSTSSDGDFAGVSSSYCDGSTVHSTPYNGLLANVNTSALEAMFPKGDPESFTGNENGGAALKQTADGRPNTQPYAFTVRVVVSTASGDPGPAMTGEDRRQLYLHRDSEMLKGFPLEMKGDGDASPVLVDLAGNDTNQLIVANSDGWIHAYQYNPTSGSVSDLPGWPVHTEELPLHPGEHAYSGGGLTTAHYDAVLEAPAAGDLSGDGEMDIVADDMQGNVYAWNKKGELVFHQTSDPNFSGAPLAGNPGWEAERKGVRQRTEPGFVTSPVLADLEPEKGPGLDIIAAGEDRHVYAWHPNGEAVKGFPVLVEDPDKVASVDATSNEPTFNGNVPANPGIEEDQGKIVDTPAVANLDGPGKPPTIIVGTNEEYLTEHGDEGGLNAGGVTTASLGLVGESGILEFANGRVYAIKATGCSSEPSSCATGGFKCESSKCKSVAFREGWPAKIGIIDAGLLPDVGEGINGSPVVAPIDCPEGGEGLKIGVSPDAGPAYVLNANGSSCYGSTEGKDNALETDFSATKEKTDTPVFAAVGEPAFGTLDGTTTDMFDPVAGLIRALDVAASDYQKGGQDFIGGWNATTGQFSPDFPVLDNDLSFITGETIGDITGEAPKQEVVAGTASLDLVAYNDEGNPASSAWPKLTGGWTVATPTLGSLGTLDTSSSAHKDVVSITREGVISVYGTPASACSASSWPNFHHDIANSGDYTRDATPPGVPLGASVSKGVLSWSAPGNQLMCGTAVSYEIVTSSNPITPEDFASAKPLSGAPAPAAAGTTQSYTLPAGTDAYVAIRAIGEQDNIGLPAVVQITSVSLPEFGRCVRAEKQKGSKTHGEYNSVHCDLQRNSKGKDDWLPGPGAKNKFKSVLRGVTLASTGASKAVIECAGASGEGEYEGSKSLAIKKLILSGCAESPSKGVASDCQGIGAADGEIEVKELAGELGYVEVVPNPVRETEKVGIDLKAASSSTLASFECGGANEMLGKGTGTGTLREIEGSVIGNVSDTNNMTSTNTTTYGASGGAQVPEHFEDGIPDTLITLVGLTKTAEPTTLAATETITNEEPIEVRTKICSSKKSCSPAA